MKNITEKTKGSFLNPLKNIQYFARPTVTEKLEPRAASENYRGFHLNDMDKCIGCGTCQKICDNAAISMVKITTLKSDPLAGIRNLRPAIDYGRCCWCALCVDICPTGAISLSREYVHVCNGDETDSYFILPQKLGIHGSEQDEGWSKSSTNDLLDRTRESMPELHADDRISNFDEIALGYSKEQAKHEASRCIQCGMCHDACPAHMHAPEYIRAIYEGNYEQAVEWMYETNPFSHVCGRVCTHRCETACSLAQENSEPIAIRWLKRFAMDHVSKTNIKKIARKNKSRRKSAKKVAVIGAGPAGLTAAYDLVKKGHQVIVYEANPKAGGMTRYGIPNYRLPENMLDRDIEVIESVGVEIICNTRIGKDISIEQLQQDHDAVLLAIGLQQGRSTRIPNSDHHQVVKAVSMLQKFSLQQAFDVPESVVIIGGGNVAMDIARSMARLQKQQYNRVEVTVSALEKMGKSFLADDEEVTEALEEGVQILDSRGPKQCVIDVDGELNCLHTVKVLEIFDDKGRFAPKYDETDEQFHQAEMIIEAIGQMSDVSILGENLTEQLEWQRGQILTNEQGRTNLDWLWSAGDMVRGPDVIHAVADGHKVAASIDHFLSNNN